MTGLFQGPHFGQSGQGGVKLDTAPGFVEMELRGGRLADPVSLDIHALRRL